MAFACVRLLVALAALVGVCVYAMKLLPGEGRTMALWVLLAIVPVLSYTLSDFTRRCYSDQVKTSFPFLYSLGMFFGVPQKVLGIICFLLGLLLTYSFMTGSVKLPPISIIFSLSLLVFGLSWLMNVGLYTLRSKK